MPIEKPVTPKDRIILALDVDDLKTAEELVIELKDYVGYFKVGMQLMTSVGFEAVDMIKKHGGKIFFDGKFYDIPNTVARASANLVKRDITFFNLHIKGGSKMLTTTVKLARETAKRYNKEEPTVLGVTILSSFGQKTLTRELNVNMDMDDYVEQLTTLAMDAKLSGVVATAPEVRKIREICPKDFIIVCPAIRPTWSVVDDQMRVVTPTDAIRAGVDFMVIGRPVINADDRLSAIGLVITEIENALLDDSVILGK